MTLSDIMTPNPKCCNLKHTIQDCAKMMVEFGVGILPVVDDRGKLIGTVTDRDIVKRAVAHNKPANTKVQDVYSDQPVHLHENDTVEQAEELMREGHIRRLIVIDDQKRPAGVVSVGDIAKSAEDAERFKETLSVISEKTESERTIEQLIGSESCG